MRCCPEWTQSAVYIDTDLPGSMCESTSYLIQAAEFDQEGLGVSIAEVKARGFEYRPFHANDPLCSFLEQRRVWIYWLGVGMSEVVGCR